MTNKETDLITEDTISDLIARASVKSKILIRYNDLKHYISKFIFESPSKELLNTKIRFSRLIESIKKDESFTQEYISDFIRDFRHLSHSMLNHTKDYSLFASAVQLENFIGLLFFDINNERRIHPRFPLTANGTLLIGKEKHSIFSSDISCGGINFFSPVPVNDTMEYKLLIPADINYELDLRPLRIKGVPELNPSIYDIAGSFDEVIPEKSLQAIMEASLESTV